MTHLVQLQHWISDAIKSSFDVDMSLDQLVLSETKKEFEGDYTLVVFPLVKLTKQSPEDIGARLGNEIIERSHGLVAKFNVIKGFLNLSLSETFFKEHLSQISVTEDYGSQSKNDQKVMVEFSSPNTNKPLHLGHIRNILLGWSCSKILETAGFEVVKTQIINDRGIAICKSMLAWHLYGDQKTPQSSGIKGDHFVGDFYVLFEQKFQEEYKQWQTCLSAGSIFEARKNKDQTEDEFFKAFKNEYFNNHSHLGELAKKMLADWERGDYEVIQLWKTMNSWVYEGFDATYEKLGVHFDTLYYESDTYLLGKTVIQKGIEQGTFYQEADGSVWVDLTDVGLDKKILLRSDGTSVYITQDIGTALQRYEETQAQKMIYTVADEQDYHFKVLFEVMKKINAPFADGLYHLSYGMVDLPGGAKMKSREGTVVDADDLIAEVIQEAHDASIERGEIHEMSKEEQEDTIRKIGLAALKYFIIKVSPKKRMTFDPKESVDMQGQTGPYIQNAYVRIQSVIRKANQDTNQNLGTYEAYTEMKDIEKSIIRNLLHFPYLVLDAARQYDPSIIANFAYDLAKDYHRFYHEARILTAETTEAKSFRLVLSEQVGKVLKKSMDLLGIEMPEKM